VCGSDFCNSAMVAAPTLALVLLLSLFISNR
jgi:hypothetical protein